MGIRDWFRKQRREADEAAMEQAEEQWPGESTAEREVWSGDVEGLGADEIAARGMGRGLGSDPSRLDPD
ncbi:MAG TPA: hypothetical protein VFQ71_07715 [Gaiellales bacterium]|jgi:hypothetical protein|nr:hypothetical protein [Gaiellales bacterium]